MLVARAGRRAGPIPGSVLSSEPEPWPLPPEVAAGGLRRAVAPERRVCVCVSVA